MKQLDIILAHSQLNMLKASILNSVNDIKEKHPTRIDLIKSMESKAENLIEAQLVFIRLEKEHNSVIKKYYQLFEENLRLKQENKELKEIL